MEKPNFTQVPNEFIDIDLATITGAEAKTYLAICRKTIGWHKDTDSISYSQIMQMTGLGKEAVSKSIKALEDKRLIVVDRFEKRTSRYTLWFENRTTSGSKIEQDTVETGSKIEHTKERAKENFKENINPYVATKSTLTDTQKATKEALWEHWQPKHKEAYGIPYTATTADWKQVHDRHILDMDPDLVLSLVDAWFSVPAEERKYYPHKLSSFATGFARAEKYLVKADKAFTFGGWET